MIVTQIRESMININFSTLSSQHCVSNVLFVLRSCVRSFVKMCLGGYKRVSVYKSHLDYFGVVKQ